jgi:hypothetical protein
VSEGPGSYRSTGRRPTVGQQDSLRTVTPQPPSSGSHLEKAIPPEVHKPTAAWLEGVLVEHVAMLASSLEKTRDLRHESKALAEMSGKLLRSEETVADEKRRADRNKSWAVTLGAALGAAVAVFAATWSAYRDTAKVATQAATETASQVVEQKSLPIEVKATASDIRITALEEQGKVIDTRLSGIEVTLVAIQQSLEQPTEVHVPKKGKAR